MPLSQPEIEVALQAIAVRCLPKGYEDMEDVYTYNGGAVLKDLQSLGKHYELGEPETAISMARDAYDWNLRIITLRLKLWYWMIRPPLSSPRCWAIEELFLI